MAVRKDVYFHVSGIGSTHTGNGLCRKADAGIFARIGFAGHVNKLAAAGRNGKHGTIPSLGCYLIIWHFHQALLSTDCLVNTCAWAKRLMRREIKPR